MKQSDVVVGGVYMVRVGGFMTRVRIDGFHPVRFEGRRPRWYGVNLSTGRMISGTAARCRSRVEPEKTA
jgi:hypothetical protein